MVGDARKEWVRPSPAHLACFESVWEWVAKPYPTPEDGRYVRVPTSRVVGMAHPLCKNYGADWRPLGPPESADNEWRRLAPLIEGRTSSIHGPQPPVTEELLVDQDFMRRVDLSEIEGAYFVKNCLHRVVAAKILGRPLVLGFVLAFTLRADTPGAVRTWLKSLLRSDVG